MVMSTLSFYGVIFTLILSEPEIPELTAEDDVEKNSAADETLEGDELVMQRAPSPDRGTASNAGSRTEEGATRTAEEGVSTGEIAQTNPETGEESAIVPVEGGEGVLAQEGDVGKVTPLPPATVSNFLDL